LPQGVEQMKRVATLQQCVQLMI